MKKTTLILLTVFLCFFRAKESSAQAVSAGDSLALVDLYNSTNGPNWVNHTNWLTASPVYAWFGVSLNTDSSRVVAIFLPNNNLAGTLPASLGNLTAPFAYIYLSYNRLVGALPGSLSNFKPGQSIFLAHNQLSGPLPVLAVNLLDLSYNNFTFADLEPFDLPMPIVDFDPSAKIVPQGDLPLIQNGNTLSIAAGGSLANNTYTWYKDGAVVATKTGDSTYTITGPGIYGVSVTNSIVPALALYSIQNLNIADSLALIDLYNSTNGSGWTVNTNWGTTMPASMWANIVCRFGRVNQLNLTSNNLTGSIPSSFGNLSTVTGIDLSYNHLSGSLPVTIGNLQSATYILLDSNLLSGVLPPTLGNLSNLTSLSINSNQISGSIPSSFGNMSALANLSITGNQLTGAIPEDLGNLINLNSIWLSDNQLSDTIPFIVGNWTNLTELNFSGNQFTGQIPPSIERLKSLALIDLSYNHLTGIIPNSLSFLPNIIYIKVNDNKLTGSIPDSLANDTQLAQIFAENNNLSGKINTNLSTLYLTYLLVDGNKFNFSAFPLDFNHIPNNYSFAPQQNIPLTRLQNTLAVTAGGNVAHNTYTLFKDGVTIATQTGDSAFSVIALGSYNIVTTNTDVPGLTLYSDTLRLGLVLPDSTLTVQHSISGTGSAAVEVDTSIFRLATLTPASDANGLNGNTTVTETIDNQVSSYNGQPYVQRHYDITPATNASTAEATVTLYFTQQDFDAFNAYVTSNGLPIPLLPTNGVDNGNVRITQYHGTYSGTAKPANYSQGSTVIQPSVSWDAVAGWWTISFPVTGFSGFFLGGGSVPLPLTLLKFSGVRQNGLDYISWSTTNEVNTSSFTVERSADSLSFSAIGQVKASSSTGVHDYTFTDANPYSGNNFYRLKMIDLDGLFTYSPVVLMSQSVTAGFTSIYPNPAKGFATLIFNAGIAGQYLIQLTDAAGNPIRRLSGTSLAGLNQVAINLNGLAAGTYFVTIFDQEYGKRELILNKQ